MLIEFDPDKRQPRQLKKGKPDVRGLVIDLSLRRARSGQDAPPRRLIGATRLPLLPGEQAAVPAVERYVLGVRAIAVKESLKIAKKAISDD